MNNTRLGGWLVILATLLLALALAVVPLPSAAEIYRPDWLLIILIYWIIALPDKIGLGIAWFLGLVLDALFTSPLGLHALSVLVVCFIAQQIYSRLRMFPFWQQALVILLLLLAYRLILLWLRSFITTYEVAWHYWLPCLVGAIIWPWVFVILRDLRRRARLR